MKTVADQVEFDLKKGRMLRDEGIALVTANNEDFVSTMRHIAVSHARLHGRVTSDDLRRYAIELDMQPDSPMVWGAIFRTKLLKKMGYTQTAITTSHGRPIAIWGINNE